MILNHHTKNPCPFQGQGEGKSACYVTRPVPGTIICDQAALMPGLEYCTVLYNISNVQYTILLYTTSLMSSILCCCIQHLYNLVYYIVVYNISNVVQYTILVYTTSIMSSILYWCIQHLYSLYIQTTVYIVVYRISNVDQYTVLQVFCHMSVVLSSTLSHLRYGSNELCSINFCISSIYTYSFRPGLYSAEIYLQVFGVQGFCQFVFSF